MVLPVDDWSESFRNGYIAAVHQLLEKFESEYYEAATEDPYYAYYVKYVIETLQGMIPDDGSDV